MNKQELIEALKAECNECHPLYNFSIRTGFERAIEMVEEMLELEEMEYLEDRERVCDWNLSTVLDCVIWHSDCGLDWQFSNPETPVENEMNYCPKCGRKVEGRND